MASGRSGFSIFVGNLSYQTSEFELSKLFSKAGNLVNIRMMSDRETGRPKGFAFCEFEDEQGAQRAIDTLDGTDVNGRAIRVNWANSR